MFDIQMKFKRTFALLLLPLLVAGVQEPVLAFEEAQLLNLESVKQKASFIDHLVTKSVSVKTIEESNDEEAQAALAEARELTRQAKAKLDDGELIEANALLDAAVKLINKEARRLSADRIKGQRTQDAYDKRLKAVRAFLVAFERVADEKERDAKFEQSMAEVEALIEAAEEKAAEGQFEEAKALVNRAYEMTRLDVRELRQGDVLVRSLVFETAEEEYIYELDRNDSHVMLLQIALENKPPRGSFAKRIKELRAEADDLRGKAVKQAGKGNHVEAVKTMSQSTGVLLKAVRMGGIFIPG